MRPFAAGDMSPGEQVAAGVSQLLCPTVLFIAVLAGLVRDETLIWTLPVVIAVGAYVLTRQLGGRRGIAAVNSLGALLLNFVGAAGAAILVAIGDFYSNF